MTVIPNCPVCLHPMSHDIETHGVNQIKHIIYCAHGNCESPNANDGFEGQTLEEAIDNMENFIEWPINQETIDRGEVCE